MKTIGGIDLTKLKANNDTSSFPTPDCPGALLRLTRQDLAEYIRNGELFAWRHFDNESLYGEGRVECRNQVHSWKGHAGHIVYAGRCVSCERLERDHREVLRSRQMPEPSSRGRREAAE